jgi:magnesium transporter
MADPPPRNDRIEERLGAALGRTAGLVVRVPLGLLGHGAEALGLLGHRSRGTPGERAGLDLQAPVAPPPPAQAPRITVIDYGPDGVHTAEVPDVEAFFADQTTRAGYVRWVNVAGLDLGVVTRLARRFALHPLAAEDVLHVPQRPKFETFEETAFIVCRMLRVDAGHLVDEQVSFFARKNLVLTFQQAEGDVWDRIRQRIGQASSQLRQRDAGYLVYALLDAIVDHCFPVLEYYGDRLADLEDELLGEQQADIAHRIHAIRRDLLILRRILWPMRDLIFDLRTAESEWLDEHTLAYLRDVHDHSLRAIDLSETFREIASGLNDLYVSHQSRKMNEVMKVLTIMATVFIPITFIAGVWGMNFQHMPELEWEYGYAAAWGIFVSVVGGLLAMFRRRGWI